MNVNKVPERIEGVWIKKVYHIEYLGENKMTDKPYIISQPHTRTFATPQEVIKMDKEWLNKATQGMQPGDNRYFIINPLNPKEGILLDEFRLPGFNEYSKMAQVSRDCPKDITYSVIGLTEEAGEVAGKVKKYWRDKVYTNGDKYNLEEIPWETKEQITKELGDVLWYLNDIALTLGISLQSVAELNIGKLMERVKNGTIHGEGDNR